MAAPADSDRNRFRRHVDASPHELPREFADTVDRLGSEVKDPVARLRFLRDSIQTVEEIQPKLPQVPRLARPLVFRYLGWRGLARLPGAAARGTRRWAQMRIAAVQLAVVAAGSGLLLGAGYSTYILADTARPYLTTGDFTTKYSPAAGALPPAAAPKPVVETEPPDPVLDGGEKPEKIWLVERTPNFELYSNGLRVETRDVRSAPGRQYVTFDAGSYGMSKDSSRPVGIVFHTTESDILPLEPENNASLLRSSQSVLSYVRRRQLYHYLIDRFGRVYRIVPDTARANHAGHSVFEADGRIHLNLNHSFFGVSFETRFQPDGPIPLTQAQLQSGRMLTDHLRSKYEIPAGMTTTHGLVSINPRSGKVGHHVDWARNFPFRRFGLSDGYAPRPASVRFFGFRYDADLLNAIGRPWAGLEKAQAEFEARAASQRRSLDEIRLESYRLYEELAERQRTVARPAAGLESASSGGGGGR